MKVGLSPNLIPFWSSFYHNPGARKEPHLDSVSLGSLPAPYRDRRRGLATAHILMRRDILEPQKS